MIVHTSILIRYCIYDILNIYNTYHLVDSVSASVCVCKVHAIWHHRGPRNSWVTRRHVIESSLPLRVKKKTCATFRLISIWFLRVCDIVSMNLYSIYMCLFIYHISDYLISFLWLGNTWEILGHPLWLPRSCSPNESHPVFWPLLRVSIFEGLEHLSHWHRQSGPQAERISEQISGQTWTNPCHPNAIPMAYHPMPRIKPPMPRHATA